MINKEFLNGIPEQPGVYIFKSNNKILYVGKAKNLKNRIKQYFDGRNNSYKTPLLMKETNNIDYIMCSNEKEALLLEQELIKKNKPYFNILFLDDKKYPYIVVELKNNKLEFKTKFFWKNVKNTYYYGPLPPNYGYRTIKNFLIRECTYENGLPIENKNSQFWKEKFNYAKKILSSSNEEIISKLKKQMEEASINEQYELAKDFRDVIFHLTKSNDNQSIKFNKNENFDVIAFIKKNNYIFIIIHHFISGSFFLQEEFVIEIVLNYEYSIIEFLNNFYLSRNKPDFIVLNQEINEEIVFDGKIIYPKKGKYFQAIKNALKNGEINQEKKLLEFQKKIEMNYMVKFFFKSKLNLEVNDFIMIDNSNEANKDITSVIIYYKNYLPFYKNYRKYKIEEKNILERKSDVEYINFGLSKFFNNNLNDIPDLIIVDGGKAQISEAKKVLKKLNLNIPVIGLIKDNNHKTNHLIDLNNKVVKINNKNVYNFLSKIQTEVDEYAKKYHSKIKINSSLEGFLSKIKGIGSKTEEKLLEKFETYSNIYNASLEDLEQVVSKSLAKKIKEKL